jgi:hypothetical protein
MKKEIETMNALANWKTTFFGGVPGLGIIIDGVMSKNWPQVAGGVGLLLVSLFAKDSNVTGGTVQQ